ncbi:MAG: MarR family transcriptional regulator [Alphaproteobacteria bacterium]
MSDISDMSDRPDPAHSDAAAQTGNGQDRHGAIDFGDLDDFVGFQLHRARNVAASVLHKLIAPEFVPGHFPILYLIAQNPDRTQSAIARAVGLDRSSLVPILNRFEKSGWVQRIPSQGDKRAHALRLTPAGERKMQDLRDKVMSMEDRISDALGDDGQKAMLDYLRRIQDAFDQTR